MPDKINIFTEYSAWYFLLCLAFGGILAYLLYEKKYPWTQNLNRFLRILRFSLLTVLAALLIGFMLKQIINKTEKPVIAFALDNSQSLSMVRDSVFLNNKLNKIREAAQKLREKGFETDFFILEKEEEIGKEINDIKFDARSSDLSKILKNIQAQYENRNLNSVVLISDGIQNQGLSPEFQHFGYTLHTHGIGDTVQRKDAGIRNVFHNKIAYLGNRFPVSVEIFAYNYAGKNAAISIYKDDKLLETQNISLKSAAELKEINFLLTAEKAGTIPYKIVFQPFEDEFTTVNNTKIIYPEIIDNKEKILLVAAAPHPDIKAIRSAIEKNENYDFEIFIPNVSEKQPDKKYDLMIFMHLPSPNVSATVLRELMKKSRKHCFIIGGNILQTTFNQLNTGLTLSLNPQQSDKVFPEINSAFNRFQLDDEAKKQIADFTPLSVPYGDFSFSAQTEILIYQRVGRIATKKPIFAFSETSEDSKTGFIIGEGFWQWRLQEFAQSDKHHAFDMLWGKFFQFIGNKSDKSRFRVSTGANEYFSGEPVSFQVEIYDEIFEKIVGQKVDLEISGKDFNKKYSFNNSTTDFRYAVEGLAEGLYTFSASTLIDGKTETVKGKFIVKSTQIEAVSVKADFNLLKNLAKKQNGKFYAENETEKLGEDLAALTPLMIAQTTEEFDDILRLPYIFIFLLFLASLEWFLRKYKGGY